MAVDIFLMVDSNFGYCLDLSLEKGQFNRELISNKIERKSGFLRVRDGYNCQPCTVMYRLIAWFLPSYPLL